MSKINIKYMTDVAIKTFKNSLNFFSKEIINNPNNIKWLHEYIKGDPIFVEKKYQIEDFELYIPRDSKDRETDFKNSVLLYNSLKDLPMSILTDERFWNWINFEKGYKVAQINMPISIDNSVLKDHWLFSQGQRRGLFFGVLSRCFFRVYFTIDDSLKDKYELTKFVINKPERFRNLSWRAYSSQKHIVLGALKAEKKIIDKFGDIEKATHFTELAKYISQLGSVMLLDVISEEEISKLVYKKYIQILIAKE
ncbi:MAG: hypothetical protein EOL97_12745 [Spirochaetia bacterium]|nr:hypothetical protein [Spirochaetia bacterium]